MNISKLLTVRFCLNLKHSGDYKHNFFVHTKVQILHPHGRLYLCVSI